MSISADRKANSATWSAIFGRPQVVVRSGKKDRTDITIVKGAK